MEELRRRREENLQIKKARTIPSLIPIKKDSPTADKIALFHSLFKGREDVYARRWESIKSGKSGYQPACKNEWIKGICQKPEIKCGGCLARDFLPLTDDVIRNHLIGFDPEAKSRRNIRRDFTIGVYPLLEDETCWFLAIDFDRDLWRDDVDAFRDTCCRFEVPLEIERSRSGRGAHAWVFFAEPIPSVEARRLGTFLLTETLDNRPEVGFDSYDRLFPSQDILPEGGFGSLIALPLQGKDKEEGNTLFIDDDFVPYSDQWAFLFSVRRLKRRDVEHIVEEANRYGRIIGIRLPVIEERYEKPWRISRLQKKDKSLHIESLPEEVKVVLSDLVYIEKENLLP